MRLNGIEVKAMIDIEATMNLVKVNLAPYLDLQVVRANIVVSLTLYGQNIVGT